MALILFGGDEEHAESDSAHKDLIARLRAEHDVTFLNTGKGMLFELFRSRSEVVPKTYAAVLYDAQLFYGQCDAEQRAALFADKVVDFLKCANAPVVVLSDAAVSEKIKPVADAAGFKHVAVPYSVDAVVQEVTAILKK